MNRVSRTKAIRRVLWAVLALNLLVSAVKLGVGLTSGALAVVADAFHSLVDSSSNVIALIGVWVAARPADENHPYGHQKYETVATLAIGGMLLVAAFEIGRGVIERLVTAANPPKVTPLVLALMAVTFAINLGVTLYETRAGRRLDSSVLLADAMHTRADLFVTLSVLGALVGARLGLTWLDPIVAGGVVILLFRAAWGILRSSSAVLTDVAVADPGKVEDIARAVPGVTDVGSVRSRGSAGAVYVDLNIKVSPAMDTDQAHGVASEVEHRISEALPGVVDTVVHIEPEWERTTASPWEGLALVLRKLADGQGLGMHDLHAHIEPDGSLAIEVHLEMAANLTLAEAHTVADQFEARAHEAVPKLRSLVTHLEPLPTELPDEAGRLLPTRAERLRQRLTDLADRVAGAGSCHAVALHNVSGHLTATLHVTQPADLPLVQAHVLAEKIEQALHAAEPSLNRVVVHVEPPERNG
ncbi:MAG: cation diffusion facilitator family transporter [Anaerolineales bacterium]|nr:cation diffusion facilitator family transporter [Anaerolineales bacterium]